METRAYIEDNNLLILGVFSLVSIIIASVGCAWCRQRWKKFTKNRNQGIHDPLNASTQITSEFTVFSNQLTAVNSVSVAVLDDIVFEPLPEIRSRNLQAVAQNIRPARFTGLTEKISLQDWFDEHQTNFPRNQLKYLREVGCAWYGQAVEGEAYNITSNEEKTQVIVKILRVDAAVLEYMQFLHEARPFRDLHHPFLLHLLGQCLEVHPFLLIMEHSKVDLKTYLIEQRKTPEVVLKDGIFLRMACNIASALQYMHEYGFIHSDVATHSCLITADNTVKVGDYGSALYMHKSDYYILGDVAFPLRWCAPESLYCTNSIIEAKNITKEANVWSLGILLWELLEFGKLPYMDYTDDEVVQKVIIEPTLKLEQPKTPCIHKDMIFSIMQLSWLPASHRPPLSKIITLLNYLYDNKDIVSESTAFEARWNSLQPVLHNHNFVHPIVAASLKFESDFHLKNDPRVVRDSDSIMSSEFSPSQCGDKSPSRCSFSAGYECGLLIEISPSLQNLRGSVENLTIASTSTNDEQDIDVIKSLTNHGDYSDSMPETISEAIRNLDIILAGEITSSETSKCTTPEKCPSDISSSPALINGSNSTSFVNGDGNPSDQDLFEEVENEESNKYCVKSFQDFLVQESNGDCNDKEADGAEKSNINT